MKIESYGYIKTDELKHAIDTTNEKEAKRWMKENFPEFVQTDSHFMSHGFIERTKTDLEQNVQQIHLVDLFSIFPDALSEKDVEYIMRSASASSAIINDAKLFGASWLMAVLPSAASGRRARVACVAFATREVHCSNM